jgi:hypothetical protein
LASPIDTSKPLPQRIQARALSHDPIEVEISARLDALCRDYDKRLGSWPVASSPGSGYEEIASHTISVKRPHTASD